MQKKKTDDENPECDKIACENNISKTVSQKEIERIINQVDGSMRIEGMPLSEEDKERIRKYAFDPELVDKVIAELVEKHTVKK